MPRTPRAETLPVIVPVVLYHDRTGWKSATTFHDQFSSELIGAPELAAITQTARWPARYAARLSRRFCSGSGFTAYNGGSSAAAAAPKHC